MSKKYSLVFVLLSASHASYSAGYFKNLFQEQVRSLFRTVPFVVSIGPSAFLAAATAGFSKAMEEKQNGILGKYKKQKEVDREVAEMDREIANNSYETKLLGTPAQLEALEEERFLARRTELLESNLSPLLAQKNPELLNVFVEFLIDAERASENQERTISVEKFHKILTRAEEHKAQLAELIKESPLDRIRKAAKFAAESARQSVSEFL